MGIFSDALEVKRGVTAVIGGGGKTSLLYRLAEELKEKGRVILCTTTHILPPDHIPVLEEVSEVSGVICVGTPCENGKLSVPQQSIEELCDHADYVLIEADGSKGLPLKAHAAHEPVIPREAENVICVVGASGIGRLISDAAHRPERYVQLAGETVASPEAVARVLTREALHSRVLINQADSPDRISAALALAEKLSCPVVVASLQKGEILCWY